MAIFSRFKTKVSGLERQMRSKFEPTNVKIDSRDFQHHTMNTLSDHDIIDTEASNTAHEFT